MNYNSVSAASLFAIMTSLRQLRVFVAISETFAPEQTVKLVVHLKVVLNVVAIKASILWHV